MEDYCDSRQEHESFNYDSPYQHAVHQSIVDAIDRGDESPWLLTQFDTWIANPNYKGPPNPPHPEQDYD